MTRLWQSVAFISRLVIRSRDCTPKPVVLRLCSSSSTSGDDQSAARSYVKQFLDDPEERLVNVILLNETGQQLGQMSKSSARATARDQNLRLVELKKQSAPDKPAVFQLMTGEVLAQERDKMRERKKEKKAREVVAVEKQMRLNSSIAEGDLKIKTAQISKWLGNGSTVRVTILADSPNEIPNMKKAFVSIKDSSSAKVLQVQEAEAQIVFRLKSTPDAPN